MLNDDVLSQFVPINLVAPEQMSQVVAAAKMSTVQKGTMLFKRAKTLDQSFYLVEGEVDLISSDFDVERISSGTERSSHSLNLKNPTTVSAVAKSEVTYIAIDSALIDRAIGQQGVVTSAEDLENEYAVDIGMQVGEIEEAHDWMSSILNSPLFSRLSMTKLQELFGRFDKAYARKGERVVVEGTSGDYFYVLAAGEAVVSGTSYSTEITLKPGSYFGEEALISNAPRNATITMTKDGMLRRLSAEDFIALVKEPVIRQLTWKEFSELDRPIKVLDVRMPIEYRMGHVPQSINIPLSKIRKSITELSNDWIYAVSGDAGARAEIATYLLCQAGLEAHILQDTNIASPQAQTKAS